ncbi:Zn-binding domain-containing protein [Micromonospora sp. M12]
MAASARRALDDAVPGLGDRVAAYRGGYLREERRELERALLHGDLLGLASTNALELGVDLVGLDAVLICGYPGTRPRCGSRPAVPGVPGRRPSRCWWPGTTHWTPTWCTTRRRSSVPRWRRQCSTRPTRTCWHRSSPAPRWRHRSPRPTWRSSVTGRRRPSTNWWPPGHCGNGPPVGTGDTGNGPRSTYAVRAAPRSAWWSRRPAGCSALSTAAPHFLLHTGAVHLHQGVSYVVDDLDLADGCALVHAEEPDWSTHARDVTDLSVVSVRSYVDAGPVGMFLGEVDVTSQVVSYQRRRIATGEVIDTRPLDLPTRELRTVAVWFTLSPQSLALAGVQTADVPGALHAAEHAAIGLLPLMATCDRWDIGGLSTAVHPDTEAPTVFVYDGHPGGAGFAERAYGTASAWLRATRDAIAECGCETGCPSCVQSPKCGNGNNPLSKPDAIRVLDVVLTHLPD